MRIIRAVCALVLAYLCFNASAATAQTNRTTEFAIRGTLPWHNFLSGPSAWNEEDYAAYLDHMQKQGLNFIGFHCYTGGLERYASYVEPMIRIRYRDVIPQAGFDTSLTARWGYRPLAVKDFAYGTSHTFDIPEGAEAFGADCAVLAKTNDERYEMAQSLMRRVIEMAHERGIQAAMGFEFGIYPPELASITPPNSRFPGTMLPDPTHPSSIEILHATIDDILTAYPDIDWVWLWLHEHTFFVSENHMSDSFKHMYGMEAPLFEGAKSESSVFNGVWALAYIREAVKYLARKAPGVKVVIGSWGNSPDLPVLLEGLDKGLPSEVVFSCLNPDQGLSSHYPVMKTIAEHRAVWAVPWLEGDRSLWHLQPRVHLMLDHVRNAAYDGLDGVVAIHWRTAETHLNMNAFARAAISPATRHDPTEVYLEECTELFGSEAATELAELLWEADREKWFLPLDSPVYYPYHPSWGRMNAGLRARIETLIGHFEELASFTTFRRQRDNIRWYIDRFRFMLLLDEAGRAMDEAYRLKNRFLSGEISGSALTAEARRARSSLDTAPLEDLFKTFAGSIRSRGGYGTLSSLNQRLWLQYKELDEFIDGIEQNE